MCLVVVPMTEDFVDIPENELEITSGSEDDFREDVQESSIEEAPPSAEEDPPVAEEVPSLGEEAAPPAVEEDPPSGDEETSLPVEEDSPSAAPEAPPPVEEVPPPDGDAAVEPPLTLDSALGSLTAYLDTRSQLENNQELELAGIETFALSPITSSSGLKGILLEVIGPYDNVVTQYKYQQANNSYYTYVNEITPDYPWIASAGLFIALVISLFSLLKRSFSTWLR